MRTLVFVDGSYLFQILRARGVARLNYERFGSAVAEDAGDPLVYLYESFPWPREGEEPVAYWDRVEAKRRYLRAVGAGGRIRIRLPEPIPGAAGGPLPTGYPPAPDVLAAVDLVRLVQRRRFGRVIFVWADAAIIPAIEHAREEGVVVQLLHGGEGMSAHLRLLRTVDEAEVLTEQFLLGSAAPLPYPT